MSELKKQILSEIHRINHIRTNSILFSLEENFKELYFNKYSGCNVYYNLSAGLYKILIDDINYCFLLDENTKAQDNLFIYNSQKIYLLQDGKRKYVKLYLIEDILDKNIFPSVSYTQTKRYDTYIKLDKNTIPPDWHKQYIVIKPNNNKNSIIHLDKLFDAPTEQLISLSDIKGHDISEEYVEYNNLLLSNGIYDKDSNVIKLYNDFFYNKKSERIECINNAGSNRLSLSNCNGLKIEQYFYNNVLVSNGTYNEDSNIINIPSNFVYDEELKRIVFDQYEYNHFGSTSFTINNTVNSYLDGIIIEGKTYDSYKDLNDPCRLTAIDAIKIATSKNENETDDLLKIKLKNPIKSLPSGEHDILYINCNTCNAFIVNNIMRLTLSGSEQWELVKSLCDFNYNVFKLKYDNMSINNGCVNCSHLNTVDFDELYSYDNNCISIGNTIDSAGVYIKIRKDIANDLLHFKKLLKDNLISSRAFIVDYLSSVPRIKSVLLDEYHVKTFFNKTLVKINVDSKVTLMAKIFK